jgi:LuxR family transcriptional regulator, maltose regulon positive regulatory protein
MIVKNPSHRPNVIERPRLLKKLEHVAEHKVTLISAPPGYGKTTLAAQFARHSVHPVAWHTVEERDRDVPNLHRQSLAALAQIDSSIKPFALPTVLSPGELAAQIADYLRAISTHEIIYILDDVQHLGGSLAAEMWLSTFVTLVPPNCHLILIGRTLPDLPLADIIARGELLTVSQEDLRLTPDEVDRLAAQVVDTKIRRARLHDLEQRLEGWPAGIVLAFYPLPLEVEQAILKGRGGPESLFDALAAPMLKSQPPDLRDFLLASSTLSRATPELCNRALQLTNSAELLDAVHTRNLFVSRTADGLVYHTLFRAFLQEQLKTTDHNMFVQLHRRAAEYFESVDESDEAFKHYLDAELPGGAAAVADRAAAAYFIEGKVETLLRWAARLAQTGEQSPNLLYRCAIVHGDRYEYAEAEQKLNDAEAVYSAQR